ncbi:MAG: glycosyltransferase family 9 protein [Planctomycetota bacterium]
MTDKTDVTEFELKTDCRHVRWDRPCAPHKKRGKVCQQCDEYDPVGHRVLMVKLAATGDVLRTTSFLPAIHEQWPGAHVTWLTRSSAKGLFAGNPLVDEVLVTEDITTAARLATEEFDVVLCPDADPDAAVLAAMAQGRERRGYVRKPDGTIEAIGAGAERWLQMGLSDDNKKANTETYQHLVADVLGLPRAHVREPILEPSDADKGDAARFVASLAVDGRPLIGLNTGAGGRWLYKQWTLAHQRAFLHRCNEAGLAVLLLGGPEEVGRHKDLLASSSGLPVFDGGNRNSYGRFAALIDHCRVVVTSDSLAVHVTAARKKPAVVLFGPTSAAEIELYGRGSKITPDLECLCCYLPKCDRAPHCQELIEPEAVLSAVRDWL